MAVRTGLAVSSLGGHPRAPRAAWKTTTTTSQRVVLGSMIASGRVARSTGSMFGRLRDLSCFMEPSTECGGGGRLPPPRVLKVSFRGDGDEDQNTGGTGSKRSGDYIPLGYGCFLAMVLLVSKCLVCWCTEDPETAFMSIDLGFLTFLGWLCFFAFASPSMSVLHPFLIELGSAVIVEEMVFSMVLVNRIRPEVGHKVTKDFLVHHIASMTMGWLALYFCHRAPGTGPVGVGVVATGERLARPGRPPRWQSSDDSRLVRVPPSPLSPTCAILQRSPLFCP